MTGRGHGVETAASRGLYPAPVTLIWKPACLERPGCPGWIPSVRGRPVVPLLGLSRAGLAQTAILVVGEDQKQPARRDEIATRRVLRSRPARLFEASARHEGRRTRSVATLLAVRLKPASRLGEAARQCKAGRHSSCKRPLRDPNEPRRPPRWAHHANELPARPNPQSAGERAPSKLSPQRARARRAPKKTWPTPPTPTSTTSTSTTPTGASPSRPTWWRAAAPG